MVTLMIASHPMASGSSTDVVRARHGSGLDLDDFVRVYLISLVELLTPVMISVMKFAIARYLNELRLGRLFATHAYLLLLFESHRDSLGVLCSAHNHAAGLCGFLG